MLKVGLTGGLACGKTFVGQALVALGCHLIEADQLGHEVLLPGGEAYADVVREFGQRILNADGTIDRKRLAAEVFMATWSRAVTVWCRAGPRGAPPLSIS